MNLYHVQHDGKSYYIEAGNLWESIELWKLHLGEIWKVNLAEGNFILPDEPESVALLHKDRVIRASAFSQ